MTEGDKGTSHYKLTTTVILQCDTEGEGVKNNVSTRTQAICRCLGV